MVRKRHPRNHILETLTMFDRKFILLAALVASIATLVPLLRAGLKQTTPEKRQLHQGRNQTVLFLSNVEHGFANIVLEVY